MKTKSAVIATLAVVLGLLAVPRLLRALGSGEFNWQVHTSQEGRYAAELPGPSKTQVQTFRDGDFALDVTITSFEYPHGAFLVSYNDYPLRMIQMADAQDMLDGARDGWLASANAQLVSEEIIEIGGHPGRALTARGQLSGGRAALLHSRVYLVAERLYQLNFVGTPNKTPDKVIQRFLTSFKVLR